MEIHQKSKEPGIFTEETSSLQSLVYKSAHWWIKGGFETVQPSWTLCLGDISKYATGEEKEKMRNENTSSLLDVFPKLWITTPVHMI